MLTEEQITIETSKYIGKGTLSINNSSLNCDFEFMFRNDGKSKFECVFYITNENAKCVVDLYESQLILSASYEGTVPNGGKIKIDKMAFNGCVIHGDDSFVGGSLDKFHLDDKWLSKILSIIGIGQHATQFRQCVCTARLKFILLSPADIVYEELEDSANVESVSYLSNFQFGEFKDESTLLLPTQVNFDICVNNLKIKIQRVNDYFNRISQSTFNRNIDITCTAEIELQKSQIDNAHASLMKICKLLSFANGNWIVPIHRHITYNGNIVMTTFFNHRTYDFNKSRYLINPTHPEDKCVVNFVQSAFDKFEKLNTDLRINKVIEYYISALTNSLLQEKFVIGYMTLEVLCHKVKQYAISHGESIEIKAIPKAIAKLKDCFTKRNLVISDNDADGIGYEMAYKDANIKDVQRYLLDKFNIHYVEGSISELYKIRNTLYHGRDYESTYSDYQKLRKGNFDLCELLDRIILGLFGQNNVVHTTRTRGY